MPKFVLRVLAVAPTVPHPDPFEDARRYQVGDVISIIPAESYQSQWQDPRIKPVVVEAASIDDLKHLLEDNPRNVKSPLPRRRRNIDITALEADVQKVSKVDAKIGTLVEFADKTRVGLAERQLSLSAKQLSDIAARPVDERENVAELERGARR